MRRAGGIVVALLLLAAGGPAAADTLTPLQWPDGLALGSAPNALRVGGADRYATSLGISLAMRGVGAFPFDSPDRTAGREQEQGDDDPPGAAHR